MDATDATPDPRHLTHPSHFQSEKQRVREEEKAKEAKRQHRAASRGSEEHFHHFRQRHLSEHDPHTHTHGHHPARGHRRTASSNVVIEHSASKQAHFKPGHRWVEGGRGREEGGGTEGRVGRRESHLSEKSGTPWGGFMRVGAPVCLWALCERKFGVGRRSLSTERRLLVCQAVPDEAKHLQQYGWRPDGGESPGTEGGGGQADHCRLDWGLG